MFTNYRPNALFTDLFRRAENNPILTASDWPYQVNSVFNPGASRLSDGQTLLLARVEERTGISHLTAERSQDGMTGWRIDPQPTFAPDPKNHPEEEWASRMLASFTSLNLSSMRSPIPRILPVVPLVSLALTRDFKTFERHYYAALRTSLCRLSLRAGS